MTEYRAWLECQIDCFEAMAHRHRGIGVYQGHVVTWNLKAEVFREALAEFDRLSAANTPVLLARAA